MTFSLPSLRFLVAAFAFTGMALFGVAFVASYASPGLVERIARQVIHAEVEARVQEKVAALDGSALSAIAGKLAARNAEAVARLRKQLEEGLPQKIAGVIAEMGDLDCECRRKIERSLAGGFQWRIAALSQANERLTTLIRTRYMEVAEQLTREFRIFTGTNALVLGFLGLAVVVRKRARAHLLPAALVLAGAGGAVAYLYLFQQDWLHTILFSDYVGLGYFAYLGLAFALLADVVFNRARVTTQILNGLLEAVGSSASLLPC